MQLHEELKKLRLSKNISLKQVSNQTKIRLDYLARIEEGDFSVAPMPFVRAFLRSFAEALGVDPARAMEKLDKKIPTILPAPLEEEPEKPSEKSVEPEPPSRRRRKPAVSSQDSLPGMQSPAELPAEVREHTPEELPVKTESPAVPEPVRYTETRKESPAAPAPEEARPAPERRFAEERKPAVQEEEEENHSVRNIIFAVVVFMVLAAAIVLIYLNRFTLF